jgi:hypothetical protein
VRAKLWAGERETTVRTVDISEGGLGLVSPTEIVVGGSYFIEFVFPTIENVFRAEMVAAGKIGFRYGFQFLRLDEENMAMLRKYQRRFGIEAGEKAWAAD